MCGLALPNEMDDLYSVCYRFLTAKGPQTDERSRCYLSRQHGTVEANLPLSPSAVVLDYRNIAAEREAIIMNHRGIIEVAFDPKKKVIRSDSSFGSTRGD